MFAAIVFVLAASQSRAVTPSITFNQHVAPLVYAHCSACHRPGQVAPFSLMDYHEVSKRAEQIADVLEQRIMPPWKPVPGHGEFSNGRSLSKGEIELVRRWVDQGAREGFGAAPPAPKFAEGWELGTPDVIVKLPAEVKVPAEGRDIYLNQVMPLSVPEGKYLRAAEFHPSNRRVVHHALLYSDTTGKARERDEATPEPGFVAVTPPAKLLPSTMSIWTPGRRPLPLGDGLSLPWPKGAELVVQLHLHPSGKPEVEQSEIGFYFTDEPPRRSLLGVALIDRRIDIPPGEKAFKTSDSCVLPIDLEATSIFPHMHMIGKQIRVTATLPDGTVRDLVRIDDWDFNWQDLYEFAEPVRLPKGTKLELVGIHDNSADNPHNPKNPPERVRWGEETFNEMSIAFISFTAVRESDLGTLRKSRGHRVSAVIVPPETAALLAKLPAAKGEKPVDLKTRTAEAMHKADIDRDGKLSIDEIATALRMNDRKDELRQKMIPFDRDGDQHLNPTEVAEVIKQLSSGRNQK